MLQRCNMARVVLNSRHLKSAAHAKILLYGPDEGHSFICRGTADHMFRRAQQHQDSRRGAAIVETAIVMPVFMMVIWGVVEFSRATMVGQIVTSAARKGARAAALDGATNATVTQEVRDFVVQALKGVQPNDINVVITITPGPNNANPNNQLSAARSRDICQVTVSIPYEKVAYLTPRFLKNANLRGVCAMNRE